MSESRGRGSGDSSWRTRRSYGVGSDGGSAAFSECGTRSSGSGERLGGWGREHERHIISPYGASHRQRRLCRAPLGAAERGDLASYEGLACAREKGKRVLEIWKGLGRQRQQRGAQKRRKRRKQPASEKQELPRPEKHAALHWINEA